MKRKRDQTESSNKENEKIQLHGAPSLTKPVQTDQFGYDDNNRCFALIIIIIISSE